MDKVESTVLLEQFIEQLAQKSYDELRAFIDNPLILEIQGDSGTYYQIECNVFWDHHPGGDLRLIASINYGGLYSFIRPLTRGLLVEAP